MILDFFKDKLEIIKSSKEQKEILKTISQGDVVWATMPLNQKKLEKIEENHRVRPYLVMHKDNANIYAYKSSHIYPYLLNNYTRYYISKDRYHLNKDSYFMLDELEKIPITNLKRKYYSIDDIDKEFIQKRLNILKYRGKDVPYDFNIDVVPVTGDIIHKDKDLNYVYNYDKKELFCYKLSTKLDRLNEVKQVRINDKDYYIFFDEKNKFAYDDKNFRMIDIASDDDILNIQNEYKKLFDKGKKGKAINRRKDPVVKNTYKLGTLFNVKGAKIAYLFSIDGFDYGVDIENYINKPLTSCFKSISKYEVIGDISMKRCKSIIDKLHEKKATPSSAINELYDKLSRLYN